MKKKIIIYAIIIAVAVFSCWRYCYFEKIKNDCYHIKLVDGREFSVKIKEGRNLPQPLCIDQSYYYWASATHVYDYEKHFCGKMNEIK